MGESQSKYDVGDRLPDLTAKEVRAVTQWARRVKARQVRLELTTVEKQLAAVPVDRGDVERA
jgi:hypothetical protein